MRYLSIVKAKEDQGPAPAGLMQAMNEYMQTSFARGTLAQTGGLARTNEGARLRVSKGVVRVLDGPFAEAREVVGGYAVLEARSEEDAINLAKEFLQLHAEHWPEWEGEAEVRRIDFLAP